MIEKKLDDISACCATPMRGVTEIVVSMTLPPLQK